MVTGPSSIGQHYQLYRVLGRGGMGEVWLGRDTRLEREVAVKIVRLSGDSDTDSELRQRLVREARIVARMDLPGTPAIYDVGTVQDTLGGRRPYIVMQRIRGTDLKQLVSSRGWASPSWAAAVGAQICAVLSAAHEQGLVHRDLKPANVMLGEDGMARVLDFGLAYARDASMPAITRLGVSLGTPDTAAPEQLEGKRVDHRADLYALGCVLYELLTGGPVFTGASPYLAFKAVNITPSSVREIRPAIPVAMDRLVVALLEKQPDDRPATAGDVYRELMSLAGSDSQHLGRDGEDVEPSRARHVRNYIVAAAAVACVGPSLEAASRGATEGSSVDGALAESSEVRTAAGHRPELETARAEARALIDQGQYPAVDVRLEPVIAEATKHFGRSDSDVIDLRELRASALFGAGRVRRAREYYLALATDLAGAAGSDGPWLERELDCRAQAALCWAVAGGGEDAVAEMAAIVERAGHQYGAGDPRTTVFQARLDDLCKATGSVAFNGYARSRSSELSASTNVSEETIEEG